MKQLVGVEKVAYTSKSGNQVSGVRIHVLSDLMPPHTGQSSSSEFISQGRIEDFPLGEIQTVLYEPLMNGRYRCTGVLYKSK